MAETPLCVCGSGLRATRCCNLDMDVLAGPDALALLDDKAAEATKLFNDKKHQDAEALALKLLDLAPNHRAALRVLFEIRKAENRQPATEKLARRLAEIPAATPAIEAGANIQLAQLIIAQGRHAEAEASARAAVIATPRDATAHHVMGVVLTETGRIRAGERHYRRATTLLGREDGTVLANLAWNMKLQGRLDEAARIYARAIALRPDNSRGVGGFAQVEMARGNVDQAISLLDQGTARWPADRALRLLRALVDLIRDDAPAVIARLGESTEGLLPAELVVRGQAAALLGRKIEAVSAYAQAKKLQRERYGQSYQPEALIEKANRYKAYFTADRLLAMPRAPNRPGPQPVFILGFSRSGSALLEQMLAKTPGFVAGDDFISVESLIPLTTQQGSPGAAFPQTLDGSLIGDGLDMPMHLRGRYAADWGAAGLSGPDVKFITDRAPGNPWNLGLIKLLFPEAPIIHVLRHPLDLILSNLGQERKLEANCGVSMLSLARHYDLTMSMIRHYRGQLTLRYLPIRYEDLTKNPKATLTHVLNFIGADSNQAPDEAALRENAAPPLRRVPAHMVARTAINDRGRYRYRDYEAQMPNLFNDVRPILKPWIDELGYGDAA